MTILHVLEPFATGTTTAVMAITKELSDFTHIVIHGTRDQTGSADKIKNNFPGEVAFIEWKYAGREINPIKDLMAFRSLLEILRFFKEKFRKGKVSFVVHLHSSKAGFLGRFACLIIGIKAVIYTPHCGAFQRTDISSFKRKLYRSLEWLGGCFGGRVVGCGPSEGDIYKNLGKNTTYVSNGVAVKGGEIKNTKRNLISFAGIAAPQKDPAMWNEIALASVKIAAESGFSFLWIGNGPEAGKINGDIIDLTGWKSPVEVEKLYQKTAIFLSASAWEGLPYGVLESMASGCALLLRNIPGHRELVIPGENGWLFNTCDEAVNLLAKMVKNRILLNDMGKKSLEIVKNNFSLKQMEDGYRKIYLSAGVVK